MYISEYLYEMATVYKSSKYGILVAVNPDSNRKGDPYFKFYNNTSFNKATKVIRIMFKECKFTKHNDGKELWVLTNKEKKLLMSILKEPSQYYDNIDTWTGAKFDWNREYLPEPLLVSKYVKGDYDELYKNEPSYLPSTLEMPNYMNL